MEIWAFKLISIFKCWLFLITSKKKIIRTVCAEGVEGLWEAAQVWGDREQEPLSSSAPHVGAAGRPGGEAWRGGRGRMEPEEGSRGVSQNSFAVIAGLWNPEGS